MPAESERHVQSVVAALQILEAFDSDHPLRLKDLHDRTGLNRSRIIRFAGTLRAAGFLEYDEPSGAYSLGPKLYAIGWLMRARLSRISDLVRPTVRRLVEASGDTAFFSIRQGSERLVVVREESREGLRFIVHEGSRRPMHAGATGKVLLAHAPDDVRRSVIDGAVTSKLTPATPTDPEILARELEDVARTGFAVSRGEATAHGFAVAVPVFQPGQSGCSALTIAGPLSKLTDELAERYVTLLRGEADGITRSLSSGSGSETNSGQFEERSIHIWRDE